MNELNLDCNLQKKNKISNNHNLILDENKINELNAIVENLKNVNLYANMFSFNSISRLFFTNNDIIISYNGRIIASSQCLYNKLSAKYTVQTHNIYSLFNKRHKHLTCFYIKKWKSKNRMSLISGNTLSIDIKNIDYTYFENNNVLKKYNKKYSKYIEIELHFLHNKLKPCFVCNKMCHNREIVFDCECGIHYECAKNINYCVVCVRIN